MDNPVGIVIVGVIFIGIGIVMWTKKKREPRMTFREWYLAAFMWQKQKEGKEKTLQEWINASCFVYSDKEVNHAYQTLQWKKEEVLSGLSNSTAAEKEYIH